MHDWGVWTVQAGLCSDGFVTVRSGKSGIQDCAPAIVWFRQDLRLRDNRALAAALASGGRIVCVYVHDEAAAGAWPLGGAARWWLHHSLAALGKDLAARGGRLALFEGAAREVMLRLAHATGAGGVYWNRRYEPAQQAADAAVKSALTDAGVSAHSFNGALLLEPWALKTGTGGGYKVYSAFARAARALGVGPSLSAAPAQIDGHDGAIEGEIGLEALSLSPRSPDWAGGLRAAWTPGEDGAQALLDRFVGPPLETYTEDRNRLDMAGTSRLSPHLHWGEISVGRVWGAAVEAAAEAPALAKGAQTFTAELLWREFSHHLLHHAPDLPERNWKSSFDAFPWAGESDPRFEAWRRGRTGYPLVDAAMTELWTTGFMHNRARMIAASFLVKHLLGHWRIGEDWFWDTLVDADLANNAASWQWVAGCGADAAPYFRIFNPVTQGQTYDPTGGYVRRWLPALARLPDRFIHQPWAAPVPVLQAAGVTLGETYPHPIVDHGEARARALAAFQSIKAAA